MSDSEDNGEDGQIENGHVPEGDRQPPDGEECDFFDIGLPTSHRYLGKLENVTGYTFYDDGEIATLPALQTNTLVFPGFTLPLIINKDLEINMLQRYINKNHAFVLLTPNENFGGLYYYGVIMQIYETQMRNHSLHLKARSRQRCKLVPGKEIKNLIGDLYQVTVKVMLEPPVTSPISNSQLRALKTKIKCNRRFHLAQYPLASWVYDKHEISFLHGKLQQLLKKYYLVEYIPDDPVQLSYWFVQNFQLRHDERLRVMSLGTAVERLRLELKFIKLRRLICCGHCSAEIAKQSDVFPMSKDGVQSNYCNPGGFVYETVTVSKATNFILAGVPSSQFSWFPGYAWTIMECKTCNSHLGWRFTSASLKPKAFYGLAKNCFDVKIVGETNSSSSGREIDYCD